MAGSRKAEFDAHEGSLVRKFLRPRLLLFLAALVPAMLALQSVNADAQTQSDRSPRRDPAHESEKEKMNAWTVGLAGGLL